ncbi:hypothetical protein D3C80_1074840 [compost metagenome]
MVLQIGYPNPVKIARKFTLFNSSFAHPEQSYQGTGIQFSVFIKGQRFKMMCRIFVPVIDLIHAQQPLINLPFFMNHIRDDVSCEKIIIFINGPALKLRYFKAPFLYCSRFIGIKLFIRRYHKLVIPNSHHVFGTNYT